MKEGHKDMERITGIVITLSAWDFERALHGDFSGEAARFLYDYYTELSDATGEPLEFDRVAIRCEWYEYETDTAFISDAALDEVEGITEEVADFQDSGDLYGYQAYRLSCGGLLVRTD